MSKIRFTEQGEPSTPATSKHLLYVDSADGHFKQKDDTGAVKNLSVRSRAFFTIGIQVVNIDGGAHIEFFTIQDNTSDIILSTGIGQERGLITLPAGKIFHLISDLKCGFSGSTGLLGYQWTNNTDSIPIGSPGLTGPPSSTSNFTQLNLATAFIDTTSGVKEIEVRISSETALTSILFGSNATIVEI